MTGPALTRQQVRRVDAIAIHERGIPGLTLMETAATKVADEGAAMLDGKPAGKHVLILCGGGNNGGDGFAAARLLRERGADVTAVMLKPRDSYAGDAKTNLERCQDVVEAIDEPLEVLGEVGQADLIIDAIFGNGLSSNVREREAGVIEWINEQDAPVLAVDIPSGLDCDTGQPLGVAVRADVTVTFIATKVGFARAGAIEYTGKVIVADIGTPPELIEQVRSENSDPPTDAS
jgi:hydroxyethylthiazole kinase-like uncharacterized protein yjeF